MKKIVILLTLITVSMAAYAENAYVYVRSSKAISCTTFIGEWYYETVYIWKNEISNKYVATLEGSDCKPGICSYYPLKKNNESTHEGVNISSYNYYIDSRSSLYFFN